MVHMARAHTRGWVSAACCSFSEDLRKLFPTSGWRRRRLPAAGLPAEDSCPGVEVLLVKVAQEYQLTDQQTATTVALPVVSTEVLAVPAGGAAVAAPPADFVSRFPQSYQQICAGAAPYCAPLV